MEARAYWIDGPWPGRLAIVPRPRGGEWLRDEIAEWKELGINTIVSFLTLSEVEESDLEMELRFVEPKESASFHFRFWIRMFTGDY